MAPLLSRGRSAGSGSNWAASGPGLWVINTAACHRWPLRTHTPPHSYADGRPCRQMTAQTGSVWLGYAEQTLAATWWLDMAYICSPHQRRQGPAACIAALSSGFSVLRLPPSPPLFVFPSSCWSLTPLLSVYLPWLWPCITNLQVNINTQTLFFTAVCVVLLSNPKQYSMVKTFSFGLCYKLKKKKKLGIMTEGQRKLYGSVKCLFDAIQ